VRWAQIKANVSGIVVSRPNENELTLLGAALCAGVGAGLLTDAENGFDLVPLRPDVSFAPNAVIHSHYAESFARYCDMQAPLSRFEKTQGTAYA
jgi:sugar (pentulose or hexulose) kinase